MTPFSIAAIVAAAAAAMPTHAATVSFTGTVANLCVLTVTTPGTLAIAGDGRSLSSRELGGAASTLSVVATGTNPTLLFGAPTLIVLRSSSSRSRG